MSITEQRSLVSVLGQPSSPWASLVEQVRVAEVRGVQHIAGNMPRLSYMRRTRRIGALPPSPCALRLVRPRGLGPEHNDDDVIAAPNKNLIFGCAHEHRSNKYTCGTPWNTPLWI